MNGIGLDTEFKEVKRAAAIEPVLTLDARILKIFERAVLPRTDEAQRAQIQNRLSLIHHGSSGAQHRLNLPENDRTAQARELFVDVKDAVLIHKGINPGTVHDFRIQLHAKTCTFTDPVTNKKVRLDLLQDIVKAEEGHEPEARDKNAHLKALFQTYFAGTTTIYKPHYRFTPSSKGPLNGASPLSPTKQIVKKHGKITGEKGFENATRTILPHLIPYVKEVPLRKQIVERHTFGSLMHNQLTTELKKFIQTKEEILKGLPRVPANKEQFESLTHDLTQLKAFREHLDKIDYFALNWALGNFPYVKPSNKARSMDEIEMELEQEIAEAAEIMEQDLRTFQSIGKTKETENDPQEAALEEEYNRQNCAGLLFLTRSSQLQNCQRRGIAEMKKESVEEVLMKEMIRYTQSPENYDGKGLKDFILPSLSLGSRMEFAPILQTIAETVKEQMEKGNPIPEFDYIPADYSVKTDKKDRHALKDRISDDIIAHIENCKKPIPPEFYDLD